MQLTSSLVKSTVVAALGGLLFGFDTAVISGTTDALTRAYALTPNGLGLTVASALVGTILGAMLAGYPGDRIGRRDSLRLMAIAYLVSALGCAFAWDWTSLVIFRLIGGIGIGGSSVLGPMYIAEISPAKWRGRLVGFFQINVVGGILVAYFSNYLIGLGGFGEAEWRWKLGIAALPAAFFFVMLFVIPRSPRWLASKGRLEEARAVLVLVGEQNVDQEIKDIVESIEAERGRGKAQLFTRKHRLPVFLAISIGMFNQLAGINAILYYLNDIFARAGFDKVSGDIQTVAVGVTLFAATLLAMSVIDKLGRKTLLLIGAAGCTVCLAGIAGIFWTDRYQEMLLWLLIGFIAFFGFSQGAVIWVYLSEVFPTAVRAKGQSLGSFTHWSMDAVISWGFPVVAATWKAAPFVFFAVMTALQFVVVAATYPETKGVSLEELEKKLGMH
jgi:MFS transporter, SP family, arabinose:H+ symporter